MNVLVAIDLEYQPEAAVDAVASWMARLGGKANLVYVDPVRPALYMIWNREVHQAAERELERHRAHCVASLEQLAQRLPAEYRGTVTLADGKAADALLTRAKEHDLVVVFAKQRGPLQQAILGSVAEKVVRACPVPIMVLPLDLTSSNSPSRAK